MALGSSKEYKATRLWNDVVRTLRSSMPVGRHRKKMRLYEDTFVATEAVDWLHQHLCVNPNFEPDVSRQQTVALLRKFQKMGIIQDARGADHKSANVPFEDNSRLFRITNIVLHSPAIRPQRRINQPTTPNSRKSKGLVLGTPVSDKVCGGSNLESAAVWRHSVPSWIGGSGDNPDATGSVLSQTSPSKISDVDAVIPYIDESSPVSRVNAVKAVSPLPDVVCNGAQNASCSDLESSDSGDLYVWLDVVLFRLKQLLRLKNVDDIISDVSSLNSHNVQHNFVNVSQNGLVTNVDKNEHLPYWILTAMKYLARGHSLDNADILSGPFSGMKPYQGFERDMFVAIRDYFRCLPEPLIPIHLYDVFVNVLAYVNNFANADASLFSAYGLTNISCASVAPLSSSWDGMESRQKIAMPAAESTVETLSRSCAEMMQEMVRNEERPIEPVAPIFKVPPIPPPRASRCHSPQEYLETSFDGQTTSTVTRRRRCCRRWTAALPSPKRNIVQPSKNSDNSKKFSFKSPNQVKVEPEKPLIASGKLGWSPRFCSETDVRQGSHLPENQLARQTGTTALNQMPSAMKLNINSDVMTARRSASFNAALDCKPSDSLWEPDPAASTDDSIASSASSVASQLPCDRDTLLVQTLQLCCLLLPPARRRRLHLLLRFMSKIASLTDLCLTPSGVPEDHNDCQAANRELVISSFAATILRKQLSIPLNFQRISPLSETRDVFAHQLVTFLVDHYAEIMLVPQDLRSTIEDRIASLERARLRSPNEVPLEKPFCRQMSADEFEENRGKNLSHALRQLLDAIIDDDSLSTREKKRRLRQFKRAHPVVYSQRFPSASTETDYFASLPKTSVFDWTLQKLRNIRI